MADLSLGHLKGLFRRLVMVSVCISLPAAAYDTQIEDLLDSDNDPLAAVALEDHVRSARDAALLEMQTLVDGEFENSAEKRRYLLDKISKCVELNTPDSLLAKARRGAASGEAGALSTFVQATIMSDCLSYLQDSISAAMMAPPGRPPQGDPDAALWQPIVVLVPKQDIAAGTLITEQNMAQREFWRADLPEDHVPLCDFELIHRKVVSRPFASGEALTYGGITSDEVRK